jgi:hypothetical protein
VIALAKDAGVSQTRDAPVLFVIPGYRQRPRSNRMKQHVPEEFFTGLIDWSPFVIMGNTVPPRDPDEDEEDEEDEADEDNADEPAVVREPDED